MKHVKQIFRLLSLFLCALMVLPLLFTSHETERNTANAASGVMDTVRIGLSVPELGTAVFLTSAVSDSGFTLGVASDRSFSPLFGISQTALALLPDRNAKIEIKDGIATGRASDSGNFGAYNIRLHKLYTSYSDARAAADRLADGFVARTDSGYEVRYGAFLTEEEAHGAIGGKSDRSVAVPAGGVSVIDCETGKLFLEYEHSETLALRAKDGGEVSLNTDSGRKSYLGFFAFTAPSYMKVVNVLELETYVKCVMANEIGTNVSVETRRAFSVLIRTVPLNSKHEKYGMDVCDSSCCQVYLGTYRRDSENDAIVDSTKGQYITYEGSPIHCLYHSSNGGSSCSSVAAWGGEEIPYLTSVSLDGNSDTPDELWQYTFTEKELYDFLSSRKVFEGLSGGISSVKVEETDPYGSGYVTLLSVTDKYNGTVSVETSEEIRKALRFDSANFTVSYSMQANVLGADGTVSNTTVNGYIDENGVYQTFDSFEDLPIAGSDETAGADRILFDGVGKGHGVGFSSVGSEQLVAEGYSYRYIIQFYFQGTEISYIS